MDQEFNDSTLWNRLKDHNIEDVHSGILLSKNVTCIKAKRRCDVRTWEYTDLKQFGVDLLLVCIDGETSYVSHALFDVITSLISKKEEKPQPKEEEKKTTRPTTLIKAGDRKRKRCSSINNREKSKEQVM